MRYLLDTNAISELRKPAGRAAVGVRTWAAGHPVSDLAISVISIMEIEIGVARLERRDARRGAVLRTWLERDLLAAFATRVLPIGPAVARHAATMPVLDPRPERDALVAATALVGNLVVVTRNTADFRPLGVRVVNPWDA